MIDDDDDDDAEIWFYFMLYDFISTVDACANNPCMNGGLCSDLGSGAYQCNCIGGYSGSSCQLRKQEQFMNIHELYANEITMNSLHISVSRFGNINVEESFLFLKSNADNLLTIYQAYLFSQTYLYRK